MKLREAKVGREATLGSLDSKYVEANPQASKVPSHLSGSSVFLLVFLLVAALQVLTARCHLHTPAFLQFDKGVEKPV